MRRTSCQNFRKGKERTGRRTAADKKQEISHEKARPRINAIGLKRIYNAIQLN